ncbi:MAG: hypothetical protein EA401_09480 [Planctomycetota bacterium]|nr:MAG: hypothetical protein EA401_09480 [Planctomycetota bacterium]
MIAAVVVVLLMLYVSLGFGGKKSYYTDSECFSLKTVDERWFNLTPWHRLPLSKEIQYKVTRARHELAIFAGEDPFFMGPMREDGFGILSRLKGYASWRRSHDGTDRPMDLMGDGNIWIYYFSHNDDFYDYIQDRFTSEEDQEWLKDELFFLYRREDSPGRIDPSNMPRGVNNQPRNIGMIFWRPEVIDQRWYDVLTWNGPFRPTAMEAMADQAEP